MKLFCSNYWQNPPITATVHYFHYNSHHHYHFHYHCKMHLYCLKILLTIPLCDMIPCLLYWHIFFFFIYFSFISLAFRFLRPVKGFRIYLRPWTYFRCSLYIHIYIYDYLHRSSRSRIFFKIGVFKNFSNFTGKHLCQSFFLIKLQSWTLQFYRKETPTQVFSCKICEIFKNTCFYWKPLVAASVYTSLFTLFIYTFLSILFSLY